MLQKRKHSRRQRHIHKSPPNHNELNEEEQRQLSHESFRSCASSKASPKKNNDGSDADGSDDELVIHVIKRMCRAFAFLQHYSLHDLHGESVEAAIVEDREGNCPLIVPSECGSIHSRRTRTFACARVRSKGQVKKGAHCRCCLDDNLRRRPASTYRSELCPKHTDGKKSSMQMASLLAPYSLRESLQASALR